MGFFFPVWFNSKLNLRQILIAGLSNIKEEMGDFLQKREAFCFNNSLQK